MKSINSLSLSGHIVANATSHADGNIVRFDLAHNFGKGQDPLFIGCVMHKSLADRYGKTIPTDKLVKGAAVTLKGSLRPNNWTNEKGEKRSSIDFVVSNVTFVSETDGTKAKAE